MLMPDTMLKPSVCYEIQKIIGISNSWGNTKAYQVQWAPSWISEASLIGCDDLLAQFVHEQSTSKHRIKVEEDDTNTFHSGSGVTVDEAVTQELNGRSPQQRIHQERNNNSQRLKSIYMSIPKDPGLQLFQPDLTSHSEGNSDDRGIVLPFQSDKVMTESSEDQNKNENIIKTEVDSTDQEMGTNSLDIATNDQGMDTNVQAMDTNNEAVFEQTFNGEVKHSSRAESSFKQELEESVDKKLDVNDNIESTLFINQDDAPGTSSDNNSDAHSSTILTPMHNHNEGVNNGDSTSLNLVETDSQSSHVTGTSSDDNRNNEYRVVRFQSLTPINQTSNGVSINFGPASIVRQTSTSCSRGSSSTASVESTSRHVPASKETNQSTLIGTIMSNRTIPTVLQLSTQHHCSICNKECSSLENLKSHNAMHKLLGHQRLSCSVCRKIFPNVAELQAHEQSHSRKSNTYNCPLCTKVFSSCAKFTIHTQAHFEERPFECKVCHKKYKQSAMLQAHVQKMKHF